MGEGAAGRSNVPLMTSRSVDLYEGSDVDTHLDVRRFEGEEEMGGRTKRWSAYYQ